VQLVNFEIPTNVTWIKANVNASGYYRVNYEPAIWTSLIRVLTTQPTAFSPADRAQLIDDAFTLAWYIFIKLNSPFNNKWHES
jgi:glutamyl aminopeptidase